MSILLLIKALLNATYKASRIPGLQNIFLMTDGELVMGLAKGGFFFINQKYSLFKHFTLHVDTFWLVRHICLPLPFNEDSDAVSILWPKSVQFLCPSSTSVVYEPLRAGRVQSPAWYSAVEITKRCWTLRDLYLTQPALRALRAGFMPASWKG